jgi:hypothetical protein
MITTERLLLVLGVYAALFVAFRVVADRPSCDDARTRLFLGVGWGVGTFFGNWGLAAIGAMSWLPWQNNLIHTVVWIGFCLSWLYLGVRFSRSLLFQCAVFAAASLVVKVVERTVLGTWEHGHFLWVFPGNAAYVAGWSLMDGLYPPLSLFALRLAGRLTTWRLVLD